MESITNKISKNYNENGFDKKKKKNPIKLVVYDMKCRHGKGTLFFLLW